MCPTCGGLGYYCDSSGQHPCRRCRMDDKMNLDWVYLVTANRWQAARIDVLELALHRIAGHGNITGAKAREIADEALSKSPAT